MMRRQSFAHDRLEDSNAAKQKITAGTRIVKDGHIVHINEILQGNSEANQSASHGESNPEIECGNGSFNNSKQAGKSTKSRLMMI